jgi:guanylate kinase
MMNTKINQPGLAVVISSPSGTGKTTICHELINRYDDHQYSISATTRKPRGDEKNGVDYIFMTSEDFKKAEESKEFIETALYVGNRYGTPIKPLMEAIDSGKVVLLDIDIQGGRLIKNALPNPVTIFLIPPSLQELERRLKGRNTEDDSSVKKRLATAIGELKAWNEYEYIVVNDDLKQAVDEVEGIINAERMKSQRLSDKKFWNNSIKKFLGLT